MKTIVKWSVVCVMLSGCGPCGGDPVERPGTEQVSDEPPPVVCGNGKRESGEWCDGDCPESESVCLGMFEVDACNQAVRLVGDASTCDARCEVVARLACVDDDGCCPSGCTSRFDSDCAVPESVCDDGVTEGEELCDGDCPISNADCDDANACTTGAVMGDASMCQALCVFEPITACTSGDGCCPAGCEGQDDDCAEQVDQCGGMIAASVEVEPATVITSYKLATQDRGFDFTGDGEVDNTYGHLIDQLGPGLRFTLADDEAAYAEQIQSGELALIFEHEGLSGLKGPATFSINAFRGEPLCIEAPEAQGANLYTRAQQANASRLDDVSIDASGQIRGRGIDQLVLPVNMGRLRVEVGFAQVIVQGRVDSARSALPQKGVALADGMLGGYARVDDLLGGIDEAIAECDCEGLNGPLLRGNIYDGYSCAAFDSSDLECRGAQASACESMIENCEVFASIISALADVNSALPESECEPGVTCDSISAAFEFTGAGARVVDAR